MYPRDLIRNLEWRDGVAARCDTPARQEATWEWCKHDLLFWINAFAHIQEPRNVGEKESRVLPFITYPYQDEIFKEMEECLGKRDLVIVKSRGVGITWMVCALFCHRWQFWDDMMFGMVSREEKLVDGTPKALFTKIQFLLDHQPAFLCPKEDYDHFHMRFSHKRTRSSITGATTTQDVFRGDRYTATAHDELASRELADGMKELAASQAVTYCRIMFSTPQGSAGAFYEQAHNPHVRRRDFHWTKCPPYLKGEYKDADGKTRSPWYDAECRRYVLPAFIAQELELDFAGSASPFFPPEVIDNHVSRHARPPVGRYRVEIDPLESKKCHLVEDEKGPLLLWIRLNPGTMKPEPYEQYVIGSDIGAGTGATPSTLSIVERRTREKVGELATARLMPQEFARLACAVSWLFNQAFFIWELNGPSGVGFGKSVIDLGYRNIYYRKDEQGREGKLSKGLVPGWFSSPNNKALLLSEYRTALSEGTFTNRSRAAVLECRMYQFMPNNTVENARARTFGDASGAGQSHGDQVIADALANHVLGVPSELEKPHDDPNSLEGPAVPFSWKWRRQQAMKEKSRYDSSWESSAESLRGWENDTETMKGW